MRVIYASLILNALALILKTYAVLHSTSSAVDAEFLHTLGDFIGSALLATGAALMFRKPSMKYPFGFGRTPYVLGLISTSIIGGFLFTISLSTGIDRLVSGGSVTATQGALVTLLIALVTDGTILAWAAKEHRSNSEDPAVKGTIVENLSDLVGDVAAISSVLTANPLMDAYGAFIISGILLFSAISLGYRYFNVLIGRAAPKNVIGRAVKVAVAIPGVIDVNDVKSLVIGPDQYLLIMEVEAREDASVEELERIREELRERLQDAEPRVKYLIVEFVPPRAPPATFRDLLRRIVGMGE